MATRLLPCIFFYGRCEEALGFYKSIFGGEYEIMRNSATPMAAEMPPEAANRVMHASFTSEEVAFMASDGRVVKPVEPDAGNISLAFTFEDGTRGEKIFNALAAGGTVTLPVGPAFWGGRFGTLVDRFGTEWMLSLP